MERKKRFLNWLEENTKLSANTLGKYTSAINTISKEFNQEGLLEGNIYNLTDPESIENIITKYLTIPKFLSKDTKGNRMYSNALKYYKKYTESEKNTFLLLSEIEQYKIAYKKEIREKGEDSKGRIIISDMPRDRPHYKAINNDKVWIRNPKIASDTIAIANNLCEFDRSHQYFTSKFSKENYVEAHHLIPMKYQEKFNNSLDVYSNVVSLCLVCHKKLHFGLFKDKQEILDKLYNQRINRLNESGIAIDIADLYSLYQD
ncbi:hypothetical protein EJF36_11580 [Bacillus sp. HMF5848]|uniref:HNH endonuclease n=1 Tax=Bacillus sp. HMF5848 TaxID=2495421 RepID=UPI000F7ABC7B|nr:HNH endonuclease [Bacillus sp. HMF5848]RSK27474.1 hypothetical protein EJF36_11580 [Bacillus sp. HMF5848]